MDLLFSKLYVTDKKNFICKCIRVLNDEDCNGEFCLEVKECINSILEERMRSVSYSDPMIQFEALFNIEMESLDDWSRDIARNRFDSYYCFDKSPFMQLLTPEFVNSDGVLERILELVSDLQDQYYSVMSEVREDEQIEDLDELMGHIRELITDDVTRDRFASELGL